MQEHERMNRQKKPSNALDVRRRDVLVGAAVTGTAAGVGALGLAPRAALAAPTLAGASGFEPLEVNSPMARWKKPQSIEFVEKATKGTSEQGCF
jgi:hypothetical protein